MTRLLTACLAAIIFCSCHAITGNGNIVTQDRHLERFDGIKASGSIDVEVTDDANQSVKVEADDNILPYIVTDVEDGMLNVHLRSNNVFHNIHVKVYVSSTSLSGLYVTGSGSITSKNTLKDNQQIECKLSGSGNIDAMLDAPRVIASIGGSGIIKLQGRTKDFIASITGSGDLKSKSLLSENAEIKVTGSGSAHVFASVSLTANVTGIGDIYYSGNPPSPAIHKTGSGSVREEK